MFCAHCRSKRACAAPLTHAHWRREGQRARSKGGCRARCGERLVSASSGAVFPDSKQRRRPPRCRHRARGAWEDLGCRGRRGGWASGACSVPASSFQTLPAALYRRAPWRRASRAGPWKHPQAAFACQVSHALLRARVVKEEAGTERLRDVSSVIQPRAQVQEPSGRGVGGGGPQQPLNR